MAASRRRPLTGWQSESRWAAPTEPRWAVAVRMHQCWEAEAPILSLRDGSGWEWGWGCYWQSAEVMAFRCLDWAQRVKGLGGCCCCWCCCYLMVMLTEKVYRLLRHLEAEEMAELGAPLFRELVLPSLAARAHRELVWQRVAPHQDRQLKETAWAMAMPLLVLMSLKFGQQRSGKMCSRVSPQQEGGQLMERVWELQTAVVKSLLVRLSWAALACWVLACPWMSRLQDWQSKEKAWELQTVKATVWTLVETSRHRRPEQASHLRHCSYSLAQKWVRPSQAALRLEWKLRAKDWA